MLYLAIHIYPKGSAQPRPSIRVPWPALAMLARFVPAALAGDLERRGIDVHRIAQEASDKLEPGVLLDITDCGDRVVIAIEQSGADTPRLLTGPGEAR